MPTKIEWTEETWNPVTGCTPVSEGCQNCYARTFAERFRGVYGHPYEQGFRLRLHPDRVEQPLRWRKPRTVFVCSMGDLFHEGVLEEFIDQVFGIMALTPWHTYQVLTKRPARMTRYLNALSRRDAITKGYGAFEAALTAEQWNIGGAWGLHPDAMPWPLPNVWLGVSVENQARADERIPLLLETPAAVRFVSCEPLLSGLDLTPWLPIRQPVLADDPFHYPDTSPPVDRVIKGLEAGQDHTLDWVIEGGESGGPPERRLVERCDETHERGVHCRYCLQDSGWRPKPECRRWLQSIRDQCQAAGVPFFFKQWGGPRPKAGGRLLDGRVWDEMPR